MLGYFCRLSFAPSMLVRKQREGIALRYCSVTAHQFDSFKELCFKVQPTANIDAFYICMKTDSLYFTCLDTTREMESWWCCEKYRTWHCS